jgi:hypothetical protein
MFVRFVQNLILKGLAQYQIGKSPVKVVFQILEPIIKNFDRISFTFNYKLKKFKALALY